MRLLTFIIFLLSIVTSYAQNKTVIVIDPDEYWWGGFVSSGSQMPYTDFNRADMARDHRGNQASSFLLSNKGRYIWSDKAFAFEVKEKVLTIDSAYEQVSVKKSGSTLREAYLDACRKHFPPSGVLPDPLFFSKPQYNTWIELMYDQNQEDILNYAHAVLDNDFPAGILMIDDNWQKYYGNFDFRPEKFSDPKGMVKQLHEMGFKVMLWICPFVSPDSMEYRELRDKGYLIKEKGKSDPSIITWWNGKSACYDFTNPDAVKHFIAELKKCQKEYGIDGFKFDAGDVGFYNMSIMDSYKADATATDHTIAWAKIGLEFPLNEYRACWQMGGQALVQRLGDKNYAWSAIQLLIPDMASAGLLGYAYACPDMIGGGLYTTFLNIESDKFDQSLIVRSAQVHTMMPMMQFSVAPWRILNNDNLAIVRNLARLHEKLGGYILDCAKHASKTGEPILRLMEYEFPNQGFEKCKDQFMLGDKYLVAPIVTKENTRTVKLPQGQWIDDEGNTFEGGKEYNFEIPLNRLLYFQRKQ